MLHVPFILHILRLKVVIRKNSCLFFFGVGSLTVKSTRENRVAPEKKLKKNATQYVRCQSRCLVDLYTYVLLNPRRTRA